LVPQKITSWDNSGTLGERSVFAGLKVVELNCSSKTVDKLKLFDKTMFSRSTVAQERSSLPSATTNLHV